MWIALSVFACAAPEPAPEPASGNSLDQAQALARELLLIDTHIDVPYRLTETPAEIGSRTEDGDFDYPRAVEGGLDVPFFSIYVPASYQESGGAKQLADELIDLVEGIAARHPDKFEMISASEQAARVPGTGRVGLALGMENGAPIEDDLGNLAHFHARGVRYITLAHSENNAICDSSYADQKSWNGLSPFGREVVAEMNRLGIMIDVSHVTDDTFDQVIEMTRAPVIASHSSCRRFTPGWERNMSDEMIRRLADNGGVIQINFGSMFLDDAYRVQAEARWKAMREYFEEHEIDRESEEAKSWARGFRAENPIEAIDLSIVADHIDHVVELVGVDHVGLGSDFDGVGDNLPVGLEDVSKYPGLIAELLARGYSREEIEKICSGNLMRVWREVERVAAESAAG